MKNILSITSKRMISVFLTVLLIVFSVPFAFAVETTDLAPVLVDPVNDPPVASPVEPGARLNTSVITGGAVKNPETGEILTDAKWTWTQNRPISAPGMYPAKCASPSLPKALMMNIYVGLIGGSVDTEISVSPDIPDLSYDGVTTWADVKLEGGVAVEKGTEKVVEGTFSLAVTGSSSVVITAGVKNVNILFTPTDSEKYSASSLPVTIEVAVGTPAWKNGEIPVVKVPFGKKITDDTFNTLMQYTNLDISGGLRLYDSENNRLADGVSNLPCGTYDTEYQLQCSAGVAHSNWGVAFLPVIIVVEPGEAHISVSSSSKNNELKVSVDSKYLDGTFDIYIDGELAFDDAPITKEPYSWYYKTTWCPADTTQDSSHSIKVVYNAAETDNAYIAESFESTLVFQAQRKLTSDDYNVLNVSTVENGDYNIDPAVQWGLDKYLFAGDEVTIRAPYDGFLYWEITDSNGNAVEDLEIVRGGMDKNYIVFKMPNYDLHINYMNQTEFDRIEAIKNCKCLCHSDNAFVQFFWNIINQILRILNQLFGYESVCDCGIVHGLDVA